MGAFGSSWRARHVADGVWEAVKGTGRGGSGRAGMEEPVKGSFFVAWVVSLIWGFFGFFAWTGWKLPFIKKVERHLYDEDSRSRGMGLVELSIGVAYVWYFSLDTKGSVETVGVQGAAAVQVYLAFERVWREKPGWKFRAFLWAVQTFCGVAAVVYSGWEDFGDMKWHNLPVWVWIAMDPVFLLFLASLPVLVDFCLKRKAKNVGAQDGQEVNGLLEGEGGARRLRWETL